MSCDAIFGKRGFSEVDGDSGDSGDAEADVGRDELRGWRGGRRLSCLAFLLGEEGGEEEEEGDKGKGAGATRLEFLGERRGLEKLLAEWDRGEEEGGAMVSSASSNFGLSCFFLESGLLLGESGLLPDSSFFPDPS